MRRTGLGVLALALLGCPRPTGGPDQPAASDTGATDPDPGPQPSACGTPSLRFADFDWVPDDSRLAVVVDRDDPELEQAWSQLAALLDDDGLALPIHADMAFRNLRFQLGGVTPTLAALGLSPAELVELHGPAGDVVWVWPSDCPAAELGPLALAELGVLVRADFERPGLRSGAGTDRFPFDLVLVRDRFVALAPRGRGPAVGAWLSASHEEPEGPGPILTKLAPAAIRAVLRGPALLSEPDHPDPGSHAPDGGDGRPLEIRATASAWEAGPHSSAASP